MPDINASGIELLQLQSRQMGVPITEDAATRLMAYLSLLQKWNKTHNLTSVPDDQMLPLHLLDSLAILPLVSGERVLDVGSGGGFPGIPLAIAGLERDFVLVDSNRKKTSFLRQVVLELQLHNVQVETQRVEHLKTELLFDCIVSRAYASLRQFVTQTQPLRAEQGVWLAMKGLFPEQELSELPQEIHLLATHSLQIPGITAARHVLRLGVSHG